MEKSDIKLACLQMALEFHRIKHPVAESSSQVVETAKKFHKFIEGEKY